MPSFLFQKSTFHLFIIIGQLRKEILYVSSSNALNFNLTVFDARWRLANLKFVNFKFAFFLPLFHDCFLSHNMSA